MYKSNYTRLVEGHEPAKALKYYDVLSSPEKGD